MEIKKGTRVKVFDPRLYIDDVKTPLSLTMQKATVVKRYWYASTTYIGFFDSCDVVFDHDGRLSKGHFTNCIEVAQ